jgi:uncharacterized protein YaeQ
MTSIKLALGLHLELTHMPLQIYGERMKIYLRKGKGESNQHVMMKLLSYILFYHPELRIEMSIGQHYKPDLVRLNEANEPVQWVDCGQTSLKKLDKISQKNRLTYIDIVKKSHGELVAYRAQALTRLAQPERVRYWTFDAGFVDELAERLVQRHDLVATLPAGLEHLYLLIDGQELSTRIIALHEHSEVAAHHEETL